MKRFLVAKLDEHGEPIQSDNHYLVVNVDEPYAEQVFELIKAGELAKGTWDGSETFGEFVRELRGEKTFNWDWAEEQLGELEKSYAEIGSAGYFMLTHAIRPLRDRFNRGERSTELYEAIMDIPE